MEKADVLENISERTGGDIYLGVVGPVRTGKSTFIRRFMELLVLPNIEEFHDREVARDELPQSGTGRTVMTTEPKFIPANAVEINVKEGIDMRVRMVDCVGYAVPGALGFDENEAPRMVHSPWSETEIPFEEAAETGTRKVITDHSTIGLLVTTDGSVTDIERDDYLEAESRVVAEMKALEKPFVIIVNSAHPAREDTQELAARLREEHDVAVVAVDAMRMEADDVIDVLREALYEFPVTDIEVCLPAWLKETEEDHPFRAALIAAVDAIMESVCRVRDIDAAVTALASLEGAEKALLEQMDPATGACAFTVAIAEERFLAILSEYAGEEISGDDIIMRLMRKYAVSDREWSKLKAAMEEVRDEGYGIVNPQLDEMILAEPELIKEGGRFGVKLKASAPSYHVIRANISTEITPLVGTEKQCEELVRYILDEFEEDPRRMWETNIFGKSLYTLVQEGIQGKLCTMPDSAREKLQVTLERMVNDGGGGRGGGIICIVF